MEAVSYECNEFARESDFGFLVSVKPVWIAYPDIQSVLFLDALDLTDEVLSMTKKSIEEYTIDGADIVVDHLVNQQFSEHPLIQVDTF